MVTMTIHIEAYYTPRIVHPKVIIDTYPTRQPILYHLRLSPLILIILGLFPFAVVGSFTNVFPVVVALLFPLLFDRSHKKC